MTGGWGYVLAGYALTITVWVFYVWWSSRSADR